MGKKKAKVAVTVLLCIMVAALAGTGVLYLMNNPIEGLDLGFLSKKEDELPAASEDQPMETIEVDPDRFIEGITVSGIDVGGMTMNEARKALFPLRKTLIKSVGYELVYEEKDISLPGNTMNLGIECNDAYVLNKAFDLGHEEMGEEELQELLNDVKHNGREFEIGLEVNEEELYDKAINDLSSLIDVEVQDATVTLDKEAEDPEKMFMYTNAVTGYELDRKAFIEMIKNNLEEEKYSGKIELPVIVTEPKIQDGAPTTEIVKRSSFSTYFGSGHLARNTRVFNIKKAVGFINGTIVAPGETFSTNETIGPRTYALGWQPAPAIVDGGASEDQAGGGVCQVSTTMYNAVVMADLEIVHRQGHSSRISYVDGGLDATINTGTIDFKW